MLLFVSGDLLHFGIAALGLNFEYLIIEKSTFLEVLTAFESTRLLYGTALGWLLHMGVALAGLYLDGNSLIFGPLHDLADCGMHVGHGGVFWLLLARLHTLLEG